MVRDLMRKSLFFKFANSYVAASKGTPITGVNDEILAEFRKFLEAQKFDFQEETEGKVKELRTLADRLHYAKEVKDDLDILAGALQKEKAHGFERYRDHIVTELNIELMARIGGDHGRIKASLRDDAQLKAAQGIAKDKKLYQRKITG
jgi:hypothetical protein